MKISYLAPASHVIEATVDMVVVTVSDTEVYYGFPYDENTLCTEAKWKVMRVKEINTEGGAKTVIKSLADGSENYNNVFNVNDLSTIQGLTYTTFGITAV